ncbi:PH domain-containing protein [Natronomonas salsuginis]|uniref:PH domain-containing protein n=1 Tax=Natronomonas salsuginis TaxID=2217661 RepID=A0A4U5J5T8_9EURY|nr:PH domain-containing protein [Natronomonas salsuginis]TKR24342.1 PH domain-containing protein [Natronomonas salsuginis]
MSSGVPDAEGVTLLDGEELLHNVRPSWSNWSGLIAILTIVTFGTLGLGIVLFVIPWLARRNARYVVTSERVIEKSGILSTSTNEYRIEDIRQLQTGASWSEKLLGHGNIQFSTGAGGSLITFAGVPNYDGIANTIREQQRE